MKIEKNWYENLSSLVSNFCIFQSVEYGTPNDDVQCNYNVIMNKNKIGKICCQCFILSFIYNQLRNKFNIKLWQKFQVAQSTKTVKDTGEINFPIITLPVQKLKASLKAS